MAEGVQTQGLRFLLSVVEGWYAGGHTCTSLEHL